MKIDIYLNALSIILFLGFGMASLIAFSTLDKQKEITIPSRYGRQTGPLEIFYVNISLLLVAVMLYSHNYRFLPVLIVFVILILLNSRMESGIAPSGVFIGATYLEWEKIKAYHIVNDAISTVQIQVYANKKQYVLRCDKEKREQILAFFIEQRIPDKEDSYETFD